MDDPSLLRVNSARYYKPEPSSSSFVNRSASSSLFESQRKEKTRIEKPNAVEACIKQRRNTLPAQSPQFLSPERFRTNSYYHRSSPTRRRRSFKNTITSQREDSWDNYSCKFNRKKSLSTSEPISSSNTQITYNVLILGDLSVGKYSLVNHLIGADTDLSSDQKFKYHGIKFSLFDKCVEIIFEYYHNLSKSSTIATNKVELRSFIFSLLCPTSLLIMNALICSKITQDNKQVLRGLPT